MSYVLPESSFNTYLSPCLVTVPENVWLSPLADDPAAEEPLPAAPLLPDAPLAAEDPDGLDWLDPDSGVRFAGVPASGLWPEFGVCVEGAVVSGLCEDGVCDDRLLSGIAGGVLGAVCGVCCDGVVSGEEDGCCAWRSGVVDGVVSCA